MPMMRSPGRRFLFFFLLILLSVLSSPAHPFNGSLAKAINDTIASDRFEGRKSGLSGGTMIEEYVAARFGEWGIEPAGERGTYFHSFPMLVTEEKTASMELLDGPFGTVPFCYGDDFCLITNSGSGDRTAQVVAVGHGLSDEKRGWDDYGDLDVEGKIVLIVRGSPDNGYVWGRAASRDSTLHEAIRRGAVGILFSRGDRAVNGAAIHDGSYFPDVPMAAVSKRVLDHLFRGTGYDTKRYREELKNDPLPFDTGKRIRFRAELRCVEKGSARNVIGVVPGIDPALKEEIIVVGGHMDHVGVDGRGLVYNGANDNGSGTSVVMELARSFASAPERPARTIAFITFAGEEQGLLGSTAFTGAPTIDLDRVVAMINLDMAGHGNGKVGIGGGEQYPAIFESFRAGLDSAVAESLRVGRAWGGESSDHAPFRNEGVPVSSIWSEGTHRFYHTIEDDTDWIDESVLGSVGRMAERWVGALAGWPDPLAAAHRGGRSLLYGSYQVDFDGAIENGAPGWVRGRVRWSGAERFADPSFINELGDLRSRSGGGDSLSIAYSLGEVLSASRRGKRSVLIGLEAGEGRVIPPALVPLLGDLNVGFVRWTGALPDSGESGELEAIAGEGAELLLSVDPAWAARIPDEGKACVRFFPGEGETIDDPDAFPRKNVLFVASLKGKIAPDRLAGAVRRLGWDRVHIDLVPWIAAGDETKIYAFLEEFQRGGAFEHFQMRALVGDNLDRF